MSGDLAIQAILLAAVFGAGVLAFLAIAPLFADRVDLRRRLAGAPLKTSRAARLRADASESFWAKLVKDAEARGISLSDSMSSGLQELLLQAGFPQPYAPRVVVLARLILTLVVPLIVVLVLASTTKLAPLKLYFILILMSAIGLYLPGVFLRSRAGARAQELRNGFPDVLDLILVCVSAGLGIDAAITRVANEVESSHPLVSEQFQIVALELRAGRTRADALKGMASRTSVPEVRAFVTLIVQADRLGASISQALKTFSVEMREARRMRAEEKAQRLPVLISIPLILFMLPTMMGVLLLPGAIQVKNTLLPAMTGSKPR